MSHIVATILITISIRLVISRPLNYDQYDYDNSLNYENYNYNDDQSDEAIENDHPINTDMDAEVSFRSMFVIEYD